MSMNPAGEAKTVPAGYCNRCKNHVWLTPRGACPYGHGAEHLGEVYEADPPENPIPRVWHCRNCGAELYKKVSPCPTCGFYPDQGESYCRRCGARTLAGQAMCTSCDHVFAPTVAPSLVAPQRQHSSIGGRPTGTLTRVERLELIRRLREHLPQYYIDEFLKIEESEEQYQGRFNGACFLGGGFWMLYRQLWSPAAIMFLLALGSLVLPGITLAGVAYCWRVNYLLYRKCVYGEERVW